MTFENEFYTAAFIKAFAENTPECREREAALISRIANLSTPEEADACRAALNENARRIASETGADRKTD